MTSAEKPDIIDILSREGVQFVRRHGKDNWACCPFHSEKTPSFKVNADTGKYHCFGCGAAGDVIDFISLRHGMSFVEAKAYLGIGDKKRQREHRAMRVKRSREAKLRLLFRKRYRDLTDTYRTYTALINRIRDWRDMLRCSVLLQRIAWIEYVLDELQSMATGREPLDLSDPLVKEVLKNDHL